MSKKEIINVNSNFNTLKQAKEDFETLSQIKVFVTNGMACCGKDSFASFFTKNLIEKTGQIQSCLKLSSVDWPKQICSRIGWNGEKDEKGRKFISDINLALEAYNNSPLLYVLRNIIDNALSLNTKYKYTHFIVDIREPYRIEKFKKMCSEYNIKDVKTIFITRPNNEEIISNDGDAATLEKYDYDYYLYNSGTLEEWEYKTREFFDSLTKQEKFSIF